MADDVDDILLKEILEQPTVINRFFQEKNELVSDISHKLRGQFEYIVIAARGTSDNAARYAQYLLGSYNDFQVALATPSLFTIYQTPPRLNNALVIGISQSGQSPDIVSVLKTAQEQGGNTLAITNDEKSPLAGAADYVIPLGAGQEKAVAATKTYSASLAALALLSTHMANDNDRLRDLLTLPEKLSETMDLLSDVMDQTSRYRYMDHCVVLGRGFNYSTAYEIALKIKELTRVITVPYSSADFSHGPIATVNKGFPIIVIAPSGKMFNHIVAFSKDIIKLGAELITISDKEELLDLGVTKFRLSNDVPEWLSPINAIIPGQLFARQLANEKGLDLDNPEGLTKVTETF
jgi:glucosamine--fructose-6-phosphate aminotransferase (isomerizing)